MKCERSIQIRRSSAAANVNGGGGQSSRSVLHYDSGTAYSSVRLNRVRMVCTTTTNQQCFRVVTVTDRIPALHLSNFPPPAARKHVTTVRYLPVVILYLHRLFKYII